MTSDYDQAAAELAALPRAERYDKLLDLPDNFAFKAIGEGPTFGDEVRALLDNLGYHDVILVERPSQRGRYTSITFTVHVQSGQEIDAIYLQLEALAAIKVIL